MVSTINGNPSSAGLSGPASPSSVPSSAQVSAGAAGGGFVPTTLFELSMPIAEAGTSGLRAPLNPEDAGALLLLAETTLDEATARTRAGSLKTRFGAANGALAIVGQKLGETPATLEAKKAALASAQDALKADTDRQTALKGQSVDLGSTVADLQGRIEAAEPGADTSQLRTDLAAAQQGKAKVDADLAAADKAVETDVAAVASGTAVVEAAQDNLDYQVSRAAAALSQIATGLRFDIGRDASQTVQTSTRRDAAYDDVADTAQRFREGDVARSRRDDDVARDPPDDAARNEDRGRELAAHLAAALLDAVPVLRDFASAPPPAVSPTAAFEAAGRVRLSL